MRGFALLFGLCATPLTALAGPWETWTVGETTYAGYCSEEADETCMMLHCTSGGSIDLAVVSLGAWGVDMGKREEVSLSIAGGDPIAIDATFREAEGFGPEFFALGGTIDKRTLSALGEGKGFALGSQTLGLFVPFELDGMTASLESALAACGG